MTTPREQTRALYAAMSALTIAQQRYDAHEITAAELQQAEAEYKRIKDAMMSVALEEVGA